MAADPERRARLLVLGGGPAQLGLLHAARALGIWTVVCDRDPAAPGFRFADRRALVSTDDEAALERLGMALQPDGVIAPGADGAVGVAARLADRLGLEHPVSPATAVRATNKLRQRQRLAEARVPQPRWELLTAGDQPSLEPPLVVKAPDRHAQKGFSFVSQPEELRGALARARAASRSGGVLVEEALDGPEVTVVGDCSPGRFVPLAAADRVVAASPAFGIGLAQVCPSEHAEAATEVARRAVEALGLERGPVLAHLRISRGGPEVISVAARLGGEHEAELVAAVTGVDLNRLALAAVLGAALDAEPAGVTRPAGAGGAVVRFLVAPPGVLESVQVPQGLRGVVRTWLYRERGYVFTPVRRRSDRAGAILVVGATRAEAVARAEAAAERIRFATADAEALV